MPRSVSSSCASCHNDSNRSDTDNKVKNLKVKVSKKKRSKKFKLDRSKVDREVLVHGSLPPQVEGQIRCFVVVRLNKPTWKIMKPPEHVFFRSMWWGETVESAAIFSPAENKVLARYPVRSGPKQMASYLADAGTLHVDVLRSVDMSVIGKVQIYGLSSLASGKSLSGPYPIFSSKSEIIGHIDVRVEMQPLHMFEDSGSSVMPTTDLDNTGNTEVRLSRDKIDSKLGTPSAFSSVISHSQVAESSENVNGLAPMTSRPELEMTESMHEHSEDLISNLLKKGQRLRSAMISSTIDSVPTNDKMPDSRQVIHAPNTQFPESRECLRTITNQLPQRTARRLHPELKSVDLVLGSRVKKAVYLSDSDSLSSTYEELSDLEDPAHDQEILDLLFYKASSAGSQANNQVTGSPKQAVDDLKVQKDEPTLRKREFPANEHQVAEEPPSTEPSSARDQPGNVRPPSRCSSASPRVCLSPALSLTGNQSDSGGSRVSFDMTASDDEDIRTAAEGLSVEQLTLLARVTVARVHIDKLKLKERPSTPVERKTYKGRPPPAKISKYGTYFVEYQFPVVAASRDQTERNTTATETVRAVSKKVEKSGGVAWNHHTVFPVYFDGQSIEKWWNSMLVLKIHHREPSSRTATLIGSCSVQMKQLLQSLTFGLDLSLPVTKQQKRGSNVKRRRRRRADIIGELKLNIQLDSDSPSFATALRELQINKARKQHPLLRPKPDTPVAVPEKAEYVRPAEPVKVNIQHGERGDTRRQVDQLEQAELMLHMLLHISEGRQLRNSSTQSHSIACGPALSSYTICRIFWSTDRLKSDVCWSTSAPNYQINESMPLHLTRDVLSNMANNYMIVEVWEKRSMEKKDQLLGYAKLPLNTFYMSYKEPRIAQVLLKSQYPVIAVDSYIPVTNPLTGKCMGEVKVLLAMGTQQQVMSLQTLKVIATATQLDNKLQCQGAHHDYPEDRMVHVRAERDGELTDADSNEHRFDVKVVAIRDLDLGDSMYMGEADCFIQYHFPTQHNLSDDLIMKSFRSATTLCTSNVVFEDHRSHVITLPREANLHTLVSSVIGATHGSAIPFELWCRFYHPNTRDQLLYRAQLPVAKLLGLVTMGRDESVNCQSYSLPLLPAHESNTQLHTVGVLDISVRHTKKVKHVSTLQSVNSHNGLHNLGQVSLSVYIESVAGLKSAALALSRKHECLDYYSTVGVNLYVKLSLSFQSKADMRVSDTEPRVLYVEEFGFRSQFQLPLLIDNNTSLAQCLQTGHLIVEVWHQSLKDSLLDDCPGIPPSSDIQLGVTSVPLANLLTHKTGIRGWYPVNPPPELYTTTQTQDPMLGALNIQVTLSGSQDMSNIMDSASRLGYQVSSPGIDTTDVLIDELTEVYFEIDWFSIPASLILRSEHDDLPINSVCYIKTSFYNNDVSYSNALRLTDKGENFECKCDVKFKYLQTVSTSFLWYLFDQNLELELWLSAERDSISDEITPSSSDKYLSTAYIPLEHLCRHRSCTLSDVYPLYKPRIDRMGRSLLQVHISRRPQQDPQHHQHMQTRRVETKDEVPVRQLEELDDSDQSERDSLDEETIETMISIEEANRLTIGQRLEIEVKSGYHDAHCHNSMCGAHPSYPSSLLDRIWICADAVNFEELADLIPKNGKDPGTSLHVTYSLAGKEHITHGVEACNKPCWMYEKCVRFHLPSILQSKHLVLKLWTKSEEKGSQVVGFTTIDLRPLLAGMSHLSGWYNIVDFTGLCQGQIKCGIEPLTSVTAGKASFAKSPSQDSQVVRMTQQPQSPCHYATSAAYAEYPSHVARYTEQQVHYSTSVSAPTSSSELLRKQLAELDIITNNLRRKLYQPSSTTNVMPARANEQTLTSSSYSQAAGNDQQAGSSRLMETVSKVHDNVLELVKHGVVNTEHLILPKSRSSHCQLHSGSSTTSVGQSDGGISHSAADDHIESTEESEPVAQPKSIDTADDSPFTPRTQVTYSMTSDDEHFSPPVYVRAKTSGENGVNSGAETVSSTDWLTDGVKPLSYDTSSASPSHSPLASQGFTLQRPLALPSADVATAASPVSITNNQPADGDTILEQLQSADDAEKERCSDSSISDECMSEVILEEVKSQQHEGSRQEVESLKEVESQKEVESPKEVLYKRKVSLPQTEDMVQDALLEGKVMSDVEVTSQGYTDDGQEYEEEEAVSRTINDGDISEQPFDTFHGIKESSSEIGEVENKVEDVVSGNTLPVHSVGDGEHTIQGSQVSPNPIIQKRATPESPDGDEDAGCSSSTADPISPKPTLVRTIPSFFPSKEELAAKMIAARDSHSQQGGKFAGRKSIAQIVKEQTNFSDRAKRVADIFSTRFNK